MKKVQDYYFKKAKKEKYPARSVYKLEEAQRKYCLLKKGDTVLDLGCQPGSWSVYAAGVIGPQGLVVGIDLQQGAKFNQPGGAPMHLLCGDILEPDVVARLQDIAPKYNVVLSDMAPRTTGNKWVDQQQSLGLSHRALELAELLLRPGGNFYCKVFEGEDFKSFVDSVRRRFKVVKVVKPKSSRSESREVFVLGMEFVAPPVEE